MGLDYVLSSPSVPFLGTESEKVTYLGDELGLGIDRLPTKVYRSKTTESTTERYFVDKFPIFIPDDSSSSHPVVSFCYIYEGVVATPGFETWLAQYSKLFSSLGSFRVIYVATNERHIQMAKRPFHRVFDAPHREEKNRPGHPN